MPKLFHIYTRSRTSLHFEVENPTLGYEDFIEVLELAKANEIITTLDNLASTELAQVLPNSSSKK